MPCPGRLSADAGRPFLHDSPPASRVQLDDSPGGQRPDHFGDGKGGAVALLSDDGAQLVVREEVRDPVRRQRTQGDGGHITNQPAEVRQEGGQWAVCRDLLGSVREDKGKRRDPLHGLAQQPEARGVGPLEVVHQDRRPLACDGIQEADRTFQGQGPKAFRHDDGVSEGTDVLDLGNDVRQGLGGTRGDQQRCCRIEGEGGSDERAGQSPGLVSLGEERSRC